VKKNELYTIQDVRHVNSIRSVSYGSLSVTTHRGLHGSSTSYSAKEINAAWKVVRNKKG